MARTKSGNKPSDIQNGCVAEVLEFGLSAASVNRIAKRAKVSVGTVYRYHETMPDLLASAYLNIKTEMHDVMLKELSEADSHKMKIKKMWFAMMSHALSHQNDFLFAEIMANAPDLPSFVHAEIDRMNADLLSILQAAIDSRTLCAAPVAIVSTMLTAPLLQTARRAAMGGKSPSLSDQKELFDMCWRAVQKME